VYVSLERFRVEETANEEEFFAMGQEGIEHLAQFHLPAFSTRPVFRFVKTIPAEKNSETKWRIVTFLLRLGSIREGRPRFEPRECHRYPEAA
jgi:hypothetical protein